MHRERFFEPVCLKSNREPEGSDIEDIDQALLFLRNWPANRRGPVYQAAVNACNAAREGHLTVEEARKSLSGFARITGILRKRDRHPVLADSLHGRGRHLAS